MKEIFKGKKWGSLLMAETESVGRFNSVTSSFTNALTFIKPAASTVCAGILSVTNIAMLIR